MDERWTVTKFVRIILPKIPHILFGLICPNWPKHLWYYWKKPFSGVRSPWWQTMKLQCIITQQSGRKAWKSGRGVGGENFAFISAKNWVSDDDCPLWPPVPKVLKNQLRVHGMSIRVFNSCQKSGGSRGQEGNCPLVPTALHNQLRVHGMSIID